MMSLTCLGSRSQSGRCFRFPIGKPICTCQVSTPMPISSSFIAGRISKFCFVIVVTAPVFIPSAFIAAKA